MNENHSHHHSPSDSTALLDDEVKDPVCGMTIRQQSALTESYAGKMFFFCSERCKAKFLLSPTGVMEPLRDRHIGASR
ncbi:YHS domain-containing protein [Aquabacterium parvum]|uniref:YHS domain-containing protein n=1 Tax=Aquabacterium parvum TaxID=70584 RepID=UPI00128F1B08|nr:YHS domain-containing protein [Aquabacterium parvum]